MTMTTMTPTSGATPITRSTDSLDATVARMVGPGPVPHNMPSIVQLNMQFDCQDAIVVDTCPLWVTPNGQDGNPGDMPGDVADAMERIAQAVLHSRDVRDMVVDYVTEQGAQDDDAPGRLTMWLDLARGNHESLRYVADMQLVSE